MLTKLKNINPLTYLIFFFGGTGFLAAFTLTLEKFYLLEFPNAELNCNINPLISCGKTMASSYAEIFNIPWSLFGVAGYPVVLLLALVLMENRRIPIFLTYITTLPVAGAFLLSTYFMFISAYLIHSFCPWCVLSAISSTSILIALLNIHLQRNNFHLNDELHKKLLSLLDNKVFHKFTIIWFILLFVVMYLPFFMIRYFEIDLFIYLN
jgi:uncharacterized membrane protein